MCGEYVYIGKKIFTTKYIDVGVEVSLNPEELQKEIILYYLSMIQ